MSYILIFEKDSQKAFREFDSYGNMLEFIRKNNHYNHLHIFKKDMDMAKLYLTEKELRQSHNDDIQDIEDQRNSSLMKDLLR